MHVAILTPEYPHSDLSRSGGLGTSIKNLAQGLVKNGVLVTVFVIGQFKNSTVEDAGIKVVSISKKKHLAFNWFLERKRIQRIIQTYIDAERIQLIEAPDWTGISAFMSFSVPLVIRLHGSDGYFCHLEGRPQKMKHYFLEKKALKKADEIVSVSAFTSELTKKIFNLKKDILTIHNSIDIDRFQPMDIGINSNQLLYYGTIIRKKGVLELAHAFNLIIEQQPKANLLLIGKDSRDVFEMESTLNMFYKTLLEDAKKQVKYLPEVPYADIKRYIAKAHVVVLPSFAEAFPMTWLETLALEKPLVSSNIGWAKELMIDGVTGYAIDPKDHKLFAERVLTILNDTSKSEAFGKAGRQHVSKFFSAEVITKQNIEFYNKLINS
jgi:glycosyltransferase involved in cell wall biosynthesis